MSLIENTLFGEINKIDIAIARLKEFEPPEGYYLAFSGGKDSQCIYHLAVISDVKFDAHFNLTTVDPPEVIKFTKINYPDVKFEKPSQTMWQLIPKTLIPPTRVFRYCCTVLKERGGKGRIVMTGIRRKESTRRSKRKLFETCYKNKIKHFLNPIIDWSTKEVWEFIKSQNLKYCSLYDEGYKRIGCIMCPMAGKKGMLRDAKRFPRYYQRYLKAFETMIENRNYKNKETEWQTAEEVMHWWIYGKENKPYVDPDQTVIFE